MKTPLRILRAAIQERVDRRPALTLRDLERREAVLGFASTQMAQYGRANLSFRRFAEAIRLSPTGIKRLFADLDAMLGELLRRHLLTISKKFGDVPCDAPDRPAKLRAAYLEATRKPFGGFNEAHLLLIRDRHLLPADELHSVEALRDGIGQILGGNLARATLDLLDAPSLTPAQIEFLVTELAGAPIVAEPLDAAKPVTKPALASPARPEPQRMIRLKHPIAVKHPDDPPILEGYPGSARLH